MIDVSKHIEKLKEGLTLAHTGSPLHSNPLDPLGVESEYGEMMMNAVAQNKPAEIVEIGSGTGYSTSWLALGTMLAGKGNITSFDYIDRKPHLREIPAKAKFHVAEFLKFDGALPKRIDFVFHDAQHRYELITADLDKVMPIMAKDSQIWVHDVRGAELPGLMREYFKKNGYEFTHFPDGNGMGKAIRGTIS